VGKVCSSSHFDRLTAVNLGTLMLMIMTPMIREEKQKTENGKIRIHLNLHIKRKKNSLGVP